MSARKSLSTYILSLAYDGTAYAGWQLQDNAPTIMGVLYKAFEHAFKVECSIVGASRTDSGVHAYDQVVRVRTPLKISHEQLVRAWNNVLPSDIVIRASCTAPEDFHPQHHVAYKEYWYHLFVKRPLPFYARFGWWAPEYIVPFKPHDFATALSLFEGEHDFSAFAKCEGANPLRSVDSIKLQPLARYGALRIVVRAKGFLRYQIRRMVGSALMAAQGHDVSPATIAALLAAPQQSVPGILKAAPEGLLLRKIVYERFSRE